MREFIKHKFSDIARVTTRPNHIINELRNSYGVHMSYKKAWRPKEAAQNSLMGSDEELYAMLPSFAYMLENCNPGSIVSLKTDKDDRFFCSFFCLATFIQGWPHCRPTLIVNGTFLKAKYCGILLTACCMDADEIFFPLAFVVVESENISSWEWFLTKMKNALGDREDMVMISDKHESILHEVKEVYPNVEHDYA